MGEGWKEMNQMFYNEDARHNYYQYPYYAPPVWASHQAQQFPTGFMRTFIFPHAAPTPCVS